MKVLIERSTKHKQLLFDIYAILSGGLLIWISSFIKLPCYPVSFTAHTLVIFFLALIQSPKQALGSTLFFLTCGTLGLPIFCGKCNTSWMFGMTAGYYLSFPIAAYMIAKLRITYGSLFSVCIGQLFIYVLGFSVLSLFVGWKIALLKGVVIFLPSAAVKNYFAKFLAEKWNQGATL